ncbi:sodium/proton-translocating pyrophosphatase [Candidatus Margulisiibacteriota bacterium]
MFKILSVPFICSLSLIVFGLVYYLKIRRIAIDKDEVREISLLISDGLSAFSLRILSSIFQIVIYLTLVLFAFSFIFKSYFSWYQILAFLVGGIIMALISHFTLLLPPKFMPRIVKESRLVLTDGLQILLQASSVISFLMVGIVILGLTLICLFLGIETIIGYSLGIVLAAFFLRIGGGIYKTSTDIGSDIVAKVEKNIPNFDKRNPATLLDLTGNFVGNIIGFGSDLLGSFIFTIASSILFSYSLKQSGYINEAMSLKLIQLPFYIISIGMAASLISFYFCSLRIKMKKIDNILLEGIYLAVIISGIAVFFMIRHLDISINTVQFWGAKSKLELFYPYLLGLVGAVLIGFTSEYMTSYRFRPAKRIAEEAEYGTVISLLNAFSVGLKSNGFFLLYLIIITVFSFYFAGFYGISMAALGMLSITPLILNSNVFAPLASNTRKTVKLVNEDFTLKKVRKMDNIGNTTAALGNGFAAGAAVLATFSLFFSLVFLSKQNISELFLVDITFFIGIIIGISLPYLFSGLLLSGLVKVILTTIKEVKRQFEQIPFLFEGKAKPDVIRASDKNASMIMNILIVPGIIMLLTPIAIGYIIGVKMLFGFILGIFLAGFNQGFYWANFGDSLHNAKHYIEDGYLGGGQTPTFESILRADNVGDAFKDLLSPSINILIKSAVMVAGLVILLIS